MNNIYDVYLCRAIKSHADHAELDALWAQLAVDYNKAMSESLKQYTLRDGRLNFNKKVIGEA